MEYGRNNALTGRDLVYQVDAARLLDHVGLEAGRGELVGLIGPNGAGKTTLLRTLSGLLRQQEGAVWLEGQDMNGLTAKEVARVMALVPQLAPYTFGFTVMEVVVMGRYPHMSRFQVEGSSEREIAQEAMALTQVEAFADREVSTLSGGERQRVFVARALAQQPRVLLLDEPTSNLDIQYQLQMMELVKGLTSKGLTAVAAMHDVSLAARFCDRLVLLHKGRVLSQGAPWEVLTPERIKEAFSVRSLVHTDPVTGSMVVTVLSPSREGGEVGDSKPWVHVIGGGGRGGRAMYLLKEAGFRVTAGTLGEGDSDHHTALVLGIRCPSHPPFTSIGPELHQEHLAMVRGAQAVVLADICFGEANFLNLEAAAQARRLILIEGETVESRDYTGGKAARLYSDLRRGAVVSSYEALVSSTEEVLARVPVGGPGQGQ